MEQIKNTLKEINNEIQQRRGYKKTSKYKNPKIPSIARFKLLIKYKPSEQYPKAGSGIYYSLEEPTFKKCGYIDEWSSLKKLIVWITKLKKQNRLDYAKIFINLDEPPFTQDKNYNKLAGIFTPHHEILNPTLSFINENKNHIVNLTKFVAKWLD